MTNIKLELFHANWCGHCKTFLPEWRKFAKEISKDAQVKVADYEQQTSPDFEKFAKINGNTINGYPTVKITVNGTEYEYNNERTAEALHNTVKELKQVATQSGGAIQKTKPSTCGAIQKTNPMICGAIQKTNPMIGGAIQKTNPMTGGSVFLNTGIKAPDKSDPDYAKNILLYKIAKYEYKYNKLYNELHNKGAL